MKEAFLHYVWETQSFTTFKFTTSSGRRLRVIQPGVLNRNAGPDFLEARIKIGDKLWVGSVEIHLRSSDWIRHNHHLDANYENTILHVVYENDAEMKRMDGSEIEHLEIAKHIPNNLHRQYMKLDGSKQSIACAKLIPKEFNWPPEYMNHLLIERLEQKGAKLLYRLQELKGDWQQLLFEQVAGALGGTVNGEAMKSLARRVRLATLKRFSDKPETIEAILLGTAGLLTEVVDSKMQSLQREYAFRSHQFRLAEMPKTYWNYFRIRPVSFPDHRIAQLGCIVPMIPQIWNDIGQKEFSFNYLKTRRLYSYWDSHFRLGVLSKTQVKTKRSIPIESILINAVVPLAFCLSQKVQSADLANSATKVLERLNPEMNTISRRFKKLHYKATSAASTQAQIHLYKQYCKPKKCMNCKIWTELARS